MQSRAGSLRMMLEASCHGERDDEGDAAGGEHKGLRRERVHEGLGPELEEAEEHRVGEVATWVELRRAHEDEQERHEKVHGDARHDADDGHARRNERERTHQHESGILSRRVVLSQSRLEERGIWGNREKVVGPKRKVHDPEERDEEENGGQRVDKATPPVLSPCAHALRTHPRPSLASLRPYRKGDVGLRKIPSGAGVLCGAWPAIRRIV